MKIKILLMLVIVCFAAVAQAQDTWIDDWIELQTVQARTIDRHNPSAVCELDWIPGPGWNPALTYDVCSVAGYHDDNVLWLVITANPAGYVGRRFLITWLKDGQAVQGYPIKHYQSDESRVEKIGLAVQVPADFDTIHVFDIDSAASIELNLTPQHSALKADKRNP